LSAPNYQLGAFCFNHLTQSLQDTAAKIFTVSINPTIEGYEELGKTMFHLL